MHSWIGREPAAGRRIELEEFDPAPKRTEREPELTSRRLCQGRVDRIEVIRSPGLDDNAVVGPTINRVIGIQGWIGREADRGSVLSELRNRVINPVTAGVFDDIRRPEIAAMPRNDVGDPWREIGEHARPALPTNEVLGSPRTHTRAGREEPILVLTLYNCGWVMDSRIAFAVARQRRDIGGSIRRDLTFARTALTPARFHFAYLNAPAVEIVHQRERFRVVCLQTFSTVGRFR